MPGGGKLPRRSVGADDPVRTQAFPVRGRWREAPDEVSLVPCSVMGTYLRRHTFFPGEESMQRRRIGRGDFDFPSPYVPSPLKRPKEGLAAPPLDFTPEQSRRLMRWALFIGSLLVGIVIKIFVRIYCILCVNNYVLAFIDGMIWIT